MKQSTILVLAVLLLASWGCQEPVDENKPVWPPDLGEWLNMESAGHNEIRDMILIPEKEVIIAACAPETFGTGLRTFNYKSSEWIETSSVNSVNHIFPNIDRFGDSIYATQFMNQNEPGSIWVSHDLGETWAETVTLPEQADPRCLILRKQGEQTEIMLGTVNRGIFITTDNGENWTQPSKTTDDPGIQCFARNTGNQDHLLVGTRQGVCESKDGGKTWEPVTSRLDMEKFLVVDIEAHPHVADEFYCIYRNSIGKAFVKRSTDGGITWSDFSKGLYDDSQPRCIAFHPDINDLMYLGTVLDGTYRFNPQTQSWDEKNNGLPVDKPIIIHCLEIMPGSPSYVFAGSNIDGNLYKRQIIQ